MPDQEAQGKSAVVTILSRMFFNFTQPFRDCGVYV